MKKHVQAVSSIREAQLAQQLLENRIIVGNEEGNPMRILLQKEETLESFLEKLTQAAFSVVGETLPENRREDVEVGIYVALSHVLASNLVCGIDCGTLPICDGMREASPLEVPLRSSQGAN